MKKFYATPEYELLKLNQLDVLTASREDESTPDTEWEPKHENQYE